MKLGLTMAVLALALAAFPASAQIYNKGTQIIGQDTGTGLPCLIAPPPSGSSTCVLPTGQTATGTFDDAAVGTVGQAVPNAGGMIGVNVAGTVQQNTGVNPSTGVYALSWDLASVGGATVLKGNGATGTGSQRVTIANDNTLPIGWASAANQATGNTSLATIATNTTGVATAARQDTGNASLATIATGAAASATAAKQDTGNASLATIAARVAPNTYLHLAASGTTSVAATFLHTICVNSLGTVASAVKAEDAATDTTPVVGIVNSLAFLGCVIYDVTLTTGLTVVVTGTVAPDVTISYR